MPGALIVSLDTKSRENNYHPLLEVGGISALKHLVLTLQKAEISPIMVLSKDKAQVENHLSKMGILCFGPDFKDGDREDYFHQAITLLSLSCNQVLVTTSDYALVSTETLAQLREPSDSSLVPTYQGKSGLPLCLPAWELLRLYESGAYGTLEAFLHGLTQDSSPLPVPDESVTLNLATSPNWEKLLNTHRHQTFQPMSKLMIGKDRPCFGPGIFQLLRTIEKCHSVRYACLLMGMSYTKGWRLIRELEEETQIQVVLRKKGGEKGGYTTLTPKGKLILKHYEDYTKSCHEAIETIFDHHYEKLRKELAADEEDTD